MSGVGRALGIDVERSCLISSAPDSLMASAPDSSPAVPADPGVRSASAVCREAQRPATIELTSPCSQDICVSQYLYQLCSLLALLTSHLCAVLETLQIAAIPHPMPHPVLSEAYATGPAVSSVRVLRGLQEDAFGGAVDGLAGHQGLL